MLLDLLQSALITWIIWETVSPFVGHRLKPEWHFIPVLAVATIVVLITSLIPSVRDVLAVVALVALLHYVLSKVETPRR